jgi:hypothetical protein
MRRLFSTTIIAGLFIFANAEAKPPPSSVSVSGPEAITIQCSTIPDGVEDFSSYSVSFALVSPDTEAGGTSLGKGVYSQNISGQLQVTAGGVSGVALVSSGLTYIYNIDDANQFNVSLPPGYVVSSDSIAQVVIAAFLGADPGTFQPTNNDVVFSEFQASDRTQAPAISASLSGTLSIYGVTIPTTIGVQGPATCQITRSYPADSN